MKKSTKIVILVGVILIALVGVIVDVSYAFLSTGGSQGQANTFQSGCLNIELADSTSSINLTDSYPITDIEGLQTTSYDFTITNTCNTSANYEINLESVNGPANTIGADYIKVALSSDTVDNVLSILGDNESVTPQLDNAYEAYNLYTGTLSSNETKTYHLKLWIDYDATVEEAANKVYSSKINVIANPEIIVADTLEAKFALNNNTMTGTLTNNVTSATYCTPTDNICTPNIDVSISNNSYDVELTNATAKKEAVSSPIGTLYVSIASNQMVCTRLNGASKIICSDSEEVGYDELVADNTVDNNIRYIGADPNNYVRFNGELWRIIGIMNNIEKADGTTESLVKIVRNENIGTFTWNSEGTSDWTTASLQTTLNNDYLNGTGSYVSTGIRSDTVRNMIETVTWKLGGSSTFDDVTTSMFYERERGTTVYSGRPTEWTGEVGLMYVSDYGYATSGGSTTNRTTCLATELFRWNTTSYVSSDCYNNDWLYTNFNDWTLTPSSSGSNRVFLVTARISLDAVDMLLPVRPTLYLKSNVSITRGDGNRGNTYILTLN